MRIGIAVAVFIVWLGLGLETRAEDDPGFGGPFTLTDMHGATIDQDSYPDKHLLVFFGYTHCPAVCPMSLLYIAQALDLLGADAAAVQALFVSVDPGRDTPAVLKAYVANFHPDIVGLTGTDAQVAHAAEAYRVYHARVDDPASEAGYLMDHTAIVYLVAPDGTLAEAFAHGTDPEAMATTIRRHL